MGGIRLAAAALVVLAGSGVAFAQETFRYEAGVSFSRMKDDSSRRDLAGLDASWYFDSLPLRPKETPYDQVQFVERVGGLAANYARLSSETDNVETLNKGSDYGATLQFARPDTFLRATAAYQDFKFPRTRSGSGTEIEDETKAYALSIGAYVAKVTSLDLVWTRSKTTSSSSATGSSEATADTVGLAGQHLMRLGDDHLALAATVSQITIKSPGLASDKNHEFLAQATYYPSQALGLTLGILTDRGDNASLEGETYIAGAKMYFTPAFSVSLDYRKFSAKAPGNNFDIVALRGALRF